MISVSHLRKEFGDVVAVDDLSFEMHEGEVVGFLGPNGAGKSTTLRILTCFLPATRGSVKIAGKDVLTDSLEVRRRLGYLPESVPVYPDMRVEEYLRFRAYLKGVARRDLKRRVDAALDRCGCLDMRRRMIGKLSKGYRQRVGIADAIVSDPPILILDEPTSGLDPNQRVEVRRLIAALGADKTVLLSSHILAEVEAVARRVVILRRGKIVADGEPAALVRSHGGGRVRAEARGDRERIERALAALPGATRVSVEPAADGFPLYSIEFSGPVDRRTDVGRAIIAAGGELRELTTPATTLEEIFMRLTMTRTEEA